MKARIVNRVLELMAESTLVQASVTLLFSSTACYMFANGLEVPPLLVAMLSLVMGFWFGSKTQMYAHRRVNGKAG